MTTQRATRAADDRERSERDDDMRELGEFDDKGPFYIPPHEIPADKEYRWVRELALGQPDGSNMSYRWRQGWRPVPASRHPGNVTHVMIPGEERQAPQVIRWQGLILCEIDKRLAIRLRERLRRIAAEQMLPVAKGLIDDSNKPDPHAFVDENQVRFSRTAGKQ